MRARHPRNTSDSLVSCTWTPAILEKPSKALDSPLTVWDSACCRMATIRSSQRSSWLMAWHCCTVLRVTFSVGSANSTSPHKQTKTMLLWMCRKIKLQTGWGPKSVEQQDVAQILVQIWSPKRVITTMIGFKLWCEFVVPKECWTKGLGSKFGANCWPKRVLNTTSAKQIYKVAQAKLNMLPNNY